MGIPLGKFAVSRGGSVNPANHKDEVFELYSIPAYDEGEPEVCAGAAIGSSKKLVRPGDVLLSRIVPHIRRVWIVGPSKGIRQIASSEWIIYRGDSFDAGYLRHWMLGDAFHRQMMQTLSGVGGSLMRARPELVNKIEYPAVDKSEQKRIAAILDKADAIRRKRQQAIQLADEFLRSVFLEMFGDPVLNPKGWPIEQVHDVCTDIVDCVNRTAKTVDHLTPYKMIRTTNVRNYRIDLSETRYVEKDTFDRWTRRLLPQKGDIVFTREAPAGEAGIITTDDHVFLGQRTMHYRPDKSRVSAEFLLFELMAAGVKKQIKKMHAGSTVTHLSVPECKRFSVRVPPIDLQRKFSEVYSACAGMRGRHRAASEQGDALFSSLSMCAFQRGLQ